MTGLSETETLECLNEGEITIEGQIMWGSNHTLLTRVACEQTNIQAVYKPVIGEQPLWDFPSETLAGREVAAYLVSKALGWDFVPLTIFRQDGPSGPGSLQVFIEHNPEYHFFNFKAEDQKRLERVALFDALINNTDRKGGHLLVDPEDKLWLIDHGICFHALPKLRTVIWDFADQQISNQDREDLNAFRKMLDPGSLLIEQLSQHLTSEEVQALRDRNDNLLSEGKFPTPTDEERSYPWPPI